MKEQEARDYLYTLWETGKVPANFTEEHSEYSTVLKALMKFGPDKVDIYEYI